MKTPLRASLLQALLCWALSSQPALAQNFIYWANSGIGNWTVATNWGSGFVPDAFVDEVAVVTNGGTAIVDAAVSEQAGGVLLGLSAGQTGTLEIRPGGNLTVVATSGGADGSVMVGDAGTGLLTIEHGGTLNSVSLVSGGETNSTITLTGTATLATGSATLGRRTRVIGPNVNFSAVGDVQFTNSSILIAEITGALHSALQAGGSVTLDGKLEVAFNGYTPTTDDTWNLIDASVIDGSFDLIEVIGSSPLGPDQELAVRTVAGGNGSIAQLHVTVSPHIPTYNAADSGHYSSVGVHNPTDTSYIATVGGSRSFFVFDLSNANVPDPIVAVTLELAVGLVTGGTFGGTDYALFEVTTPIATLVAGGSDLIGVYGDLGDGPAYSAVTWIDPADQGTTKSIPLLSTGVSVVNAAKSGQIAIGGSASGSGGHFAFGSTDVTGARLIVEFGWPAPSITDSLLVGTQFNLRFTGEPGVTNWQVMGSHDLPVFGEDRTADSTISETSPGVYQAVVELGSRTNRYFMRIAR